MVEGLISVRNPVAVLREEFDDWAVLFNPDTAQAVGINPVGVTVWKLLDGKRSLEEVLNAISEAYEGVPESAGEEVSQFIEDLTNGGFVGYELECFE